MKENLKPRTHKQSEGQVLALRPVGLTACLLKNDPAS